MELYENVGVVLPAPLESLLEVSFCHRADDHACGKLKGLIHEEDGKAWAQTPWGAGISAYDLKGGRNLVFSGLITRICIRKGRKLEVELEWAGFSVLMDIEKKTRSFQKTGDTYGERFLTLVKEYGGDFMDRGGGGKTIETPYVQFEETDWEFMKRLASMAGAHIYPGIKGTVPQVYMGLGDGGQEGAFPVWEAAKKQVKEYLAFQQYKSAMEQSFLLCRVKGYGRYEVGDMVQCAGAALQVAEVQGRMEHGEWVYQYGLGQKGDRPVPQRKNSRLKGKGFQGTVLAVGNDQVRLHLDIDREQKEQEAFWYPCKRIDWYCMPEAGSKAMLCFASDDEGEAYVSALHRTDGEENEKSHDPQVKYLGTQPGKEWKFSPGAIRLHGGEGTVFINLDQKEGIQVQSKEDISVSSEGGILLNGEHIAIDSKDRVLLHTKKTVIVMDCKVQMKG